jgi:hypothetical protein
LSRIGNGHESELDRKPEARQDRIPTSTAVYLLEPSAMPGQVMSDEKQLAEKAFPWRCPKCRQSAVNRVTMPYSCQRMHRGRAVTVEFPNLAVPRCSNCGEVVFDYAADEQIRAALQSQFGPAK